MSRERLDNSENQVVRPLPICTIGHVEAQIDVTSAKITQVVSDVRTLTEREVLACGNVLADIVATARNLTAESESSLALSLSRSEEVNSRFVQGMREDLLAQTNAVHHVLDLAHGIESAVEAINDLTGSSRVLAINARIEAARLGEHGRGFAVIADNLSSLSKAIRATSEKVSSSIAAVRHGLDPVRDRAASMDDRTKVFVEQVAAQVNLDLPPASAAGSAGRLAAFTELSNQALSHLQFQDPVSQKLQTIHNELTSMQERVRQALTGDMKFAEIANEEAIGSEPISGEVMLF